MTYHPEEKDQSTISGHIHYEFRDLVTGQTSSADYTNSVTYESRWNLRGGPNSPSWPSIKSENGYFYGKTTSTFEPFDLRASRTIGTFSEVYEGTQTYGYSSPANDGSSNSLGPLARALSINHAKVVNKLLSNLSQQKVNVAQFIAEREQTKNLVASTARRIAQSVLALRKGDPNKALAMLLGTSGPRDSFRRRYGGIPEQWLALQYGWKPLLSDVYGACEQLANLTTYEPDAISVTASATTVVENSEYTVHGDGGWIPDLIWSCSGAQVRGRGSVHAKVSVPFLNTASSTGIINPLTLAWELIPYSFVVDWFYPVGDFLERCNATDGLSFSKGFIAQKAVVPWKGRFAKTHFSSSGWDVSIGGGNPRAEVISYEREALSWFPSPSWPSFKDPFSSTHVANALSLLSTAFGRGARVR